MGQQQSSRLPSLRRAIRENSEELTEVELREIVLTDRAMTKLAEALRNNK